MLLAPTKEEANPWKWGRLDSRRGAGELLFGRMYEDSAIELEEFMGRPRIFCIASAGCTPLALAAAGHEVTAVDINPVQIAYVKARLAGGAIREGRVDRLLGLGRRLLPLLGWHPALLKKFLQLENTTVQVGFWRSYLDSTRWRTALGFLLHPRILRSRYSFPFIHSLPR